MMAIQHCALVAHQHKNPIKIPLVRPSGIGHRAHGIRHHEIFTCGDLGVINNTRQIEVSDDQTTSLLFR